MDYIGIEPITFRLWGDCSTNELIVLMCCFHALEHYSQHFSKKRNLVCTPFTMCNCPNWIRTNITRVKFLCANLYTIEQYVGCEFILYDGRVHSLRATISQDTSLYHACVLMTLTYELIITFVLCFVNNFFIFLLCF